jgi:hypothetical protein
MKVSDMDKDEAPFGVPEAPTAGAWLGIVGGRHRHRAGMRGLDPVELGNHPSSRAEPG